MESDIILSSICHSETGHHSWTRIVWICRFSWIPGCCSSSAQGLCKLGLSSNSMNRAHFQRHAQVSVFLFLLLLIIIIIIYL